MLLQQLVQPDLTVGLQVKHRKGFIIDRLLVLI